MLKNIKKDDLVKRRKEACDIINQYAKLELRGLSQTNEFSYDDFKDLKSTDSEKKKNLITLSFFASLLIAI